MATTAAADTSIHGEDRGGNQRRGGPEKGFEKQPPQPSSLFPSTIFVFHLGRKEWSMASLVDVFAQGLDRGPRDRVLPSLPDSTYADHHRGRESPNSCEVEHENRRPSVRRDRLSVRSGVAMAGDGMNGGAAVAPAAVTD